MITLAYLVDYCFKAVAFIFILVWQVPPVRNMLQIDLLASSIPVAALLAVLGIARPKVWELAIPAMAAQAMRRRKAQAKQAQQGKSDSHRV